MINFLIKSYRSYRENKKYDIEYADRCESILNDIVDGNLDIQNILSFAPKKSTFKMKKGETFLFSVDAILGTYKRDGRVSAVGLTGRVKIAKGIYLRAGSGRAEASRSWVFDETGTLHVTSERIIFDGKYKNYTVSLSKIIKLGIDPVQHILCVDKVSGSDWQFKVPSWPAEELMSAFVAIQRGYA